MAVTPLDFIQIIRLKEAGASKNSFNSSESSNQGHVLIFLDCGKWSLFCLQFDED